MTFKTNMKLALLGLGLMGVVATVPATAGDVYVIAHQSVLLSQEEVKDVYLGEKQFAGSLKLVPIDNSAVQGDFLAKAIKIDGSKYAALWTKKGFRGGLAAPLIKTDDAEVINLVKSTRGAVGYISSPPPRGVSELFKY